MDMNKLLKSSIDITGKIPLVLKNKLQSAGVIVDGLVISGNDIDVTLNANNTNTDIAATFVGNGKWVVDSLDDNANLFPEIEEGDSVSIDMFTKLFMDSINSGLILSFNPLGRVKYGIKDKVDKVKDVGRKIKDWATDRLYAEDAEKFIRGNGPYRRTFTDSRDGVTRTKKDYNAGRVNVGKVESLGKMGHYKVLSGNPATGDFQVWHLYKNGNKIRCIDLKTGLQAQEAQWVYDNNIPKSWTEADWNPSGDVPEKASDMKIGETEEAKKEAKEAQENTEENNVTEETSQTEETTEQSTEDNVEQTEENNVIEETSDNGEEDNVIDDMDPDTWFEDEDPQEVLETEEDNVTEEKPKSKKKTVAASFIKSSEDEEEDNVIESKPKKKSKYNGCNVTGYQDGMLGTMGVASSFICQDLKQFIQHTETLKNVDKKVNEQWNKIKKLLLDISVLDKDVLKAMTKQDSGTNLTIDFNETNTGQNYTITIEFRPDALVISDKVVKPEMAYDHLIQSLKTVKKSLEPKV